MSGGEYEDHDFSSLGLRVRAPVEVDTPAEEPKPYSEFDLDAALKRHENIRDYQPTRFVVVWEKEHPYKTQPGVWISPQEYDYQSQFHRRTAADFPDMLNIHVKPPSSRPVSRESILLRPKTAASSPGLSPGYTQAPARSSLSRGGKVRRQPVILHPATPVGFSSAPGPGNYRPRDYAVSAHVSTVRFAQGTRRMVAPTSSPAGPGHYSPQSEVVTAAQPAQRFASSPRFRGPSAGGAGQNTPGPGHYSARPVSSRAHAFPPPASIEGRERVLTQAGPGSYEAAALARCADHKFGLSKRFSSAPVPPSHVLVMADARKRARKAARALAVGSPRPSEQPPRPEMAQFRADRRLARMQTAAIERNGRLAAARVQRQQEVLSHHERMEKALNRSRFAEMEAVRAEAEENQLKFTRGWLFFIALCSRQQVLLCRLNARLSANYRSCMAHNGCMKLKRAVKRFLARRNIEARNKAACTIQRRFRKHRLSRRARVESRAVHICMYLLEKSYGMMRLFIHARARIKKFQFIQRLIRNRSDIQRARMQLLMLQWKKCEDELILQIGKLAVKSAKKVGKKVEEKKTDVASVAAYHPRADPAVVEIMLKKDLHNRRIVHQQALKQWLSTRKHFEGLTIAKSKLQAANKVAPTRNDAHELLGVIAALPPEPRKPYFRTLLPPATAMGLAHDAISELPVMSAQAKAKLRKACVTLQETMQPPPIDNPPKRP
jgi:hypothetical protein